MESHGSASGLWTMLLVDESDIDLMVGANCVRREVDVFGIGNETGFTRPWLPTLNALKA